MRIIHRSQWTSWLFFLAFLAPVPVAAQGTKADYARAADLQRLTRGMVFRDRVEPHWFDENRRFWYKVRTAPERHEFVVVDAGKGERRPAFDHQKLANALAKNKINAPADRLPIDQLDFDPAGKYVDLHVAGGWWRCNLESYVLLSRPAAAHADNTARHSLQPFEGGPRASRRTGDDTTLTFINHTAGDVQLFWLDMEGKRQGYGRLRPGQMHEQHTYAGHVWLVVDAKGNPLGLKIAEDKDVTVEIGEPEKKPKTKPEKKPAKKTEKKPDKAEPRLLEQDFPAAGSRATRRQPGPRPQAKSPDGRWEAFVKENNVWARSSGGEEFALSHDGAAEDGYGAMLFWSPDSKKLVAVRTRQCPERKVYFIESSPRDQLQPKLHSHTYVKPGDPLPVQRPQLFDIASRKPIAVENRLFDNPWSIEDYR
jgi:dipeptidyl-peptidase 4